jgi:hypothetical protein
VSDEDEERPGPHAPPISINQEIVDLLSELLEVAVATVSALGDIKTDLDQIAANTAACACSDLLGQILATDQTIAATLASILQDLTPTPGGPAASVTLTWRAPQPKP